MFVFLFSHWLLLVARVPLPYVHLPSPLSSSPMCSSSLHFLNHWNRMPGEVNCKELNGVKKPMVRKTTERNTAGERVYGPVSSAQWNLHVSPLCQYYFTAGTIDSHPATLDLVLLARWLVLMNWLTPSSRLDSMNHLDSETGESWWFGWTGHSAFDWLLLASVTQSMFRGFQHLTDTCSWTGYYW